jgi:mono/diheme cytochrome c family protein
MKFLSGLLSGFVLLALAAGFVIATGVFSVGATSPPGDLERKFAAFTVNRSVARRAPRGPNSTAPTAENRAVGLAHYRSMCVTCHGAPGVDPSEIGEGLNPPAPDLTLPKVQGRTDGELFWIVQNGLRMTGMPAFGPTHREDEIWKIVAFLRHLPELTPEEEKALASKERAAD